MKLDVNQLRYLSKDDFRVLQAVELGQKNVRAILDKQLCSDVITVVCGRQQICIAGAVAARDCAGGAHRYHSWPQVGTLSCGSLRKAQRSFQAPCCLPWSLAGPDFYARVCAGTVAQCAA